MTEQEFHTLRDGKDGHKDASMNVFHNNEIIVQIWNKNFIIKLFPFIYNKFVIKVCTQ